MTTHGTLPAPPPEPGASPLRFEGRLEPVSRWLWLVKWFLLIPHYVVLAFLFAASVATTLVAFVAILITGRYPRWAFDFNVGVLRWSWRVGFYGYSALGTDSYPPFTLEARADDLARLAVRYPEALARPLVLVKWVLAIPHCLVVAALGGGTVVALHNVYSFPASGVIGLLVFATGLVLLFTAEYPRGMFDLVVGLNRWVYRVLVYVMLMSDEYPPFRLDMGGEEPRTASAGTVPAPPPPPPPGSIAHRPTPYRGGA